MQMFIVMNPEKDRVYSLSMVDNGPEMRLIEKLGTEQFTMDKAYFAEWVIMDTWLPAVFPVKEWANAVGEDFCGDQFVIVELTVV